jgi:hypothetical protein
MSHEEAGSDSLEPITERLQSTHERVRRLYLHYHGTLMVTTPDGPQMLLVVDKPEKTNLLSFISLELSSKLSPNSQVLEVVVDENELIPQIDPVASEIIRQAKEIEDIGGVRYVVDLVDPQFREILRQLSEWTQDANLPTILNQLKSTNGKDYARWQTMNPEYSGKIGLLDSKGRAFLFANSREELYQGSQYQTIAERVTGALHSPQGHFNAELILAIGEDKIDEIHPSPILREVTQRIIKDNIPISRGQVFSLNHNFHGLCAQPEVREVVLGYFFRGSEEYRAVCIAQSEVIRILAIRELEAITKPQN